MPLYAWLPLGISACVTAWAAARVHLALVAASFAVFLDNVLSLYVDNNSWCLNGVIAWACAVITLTWPRCPNVVIASLFGGSLTASLGFGMAGWLSPEATTYPQQLLEYQRSMSYWYVNLALTSCQCAVLLGWTGYDLGGGKRSRSRLNSVCTRLSFGGATHRGHR